jgi:anti-anti-sigma factor
MHARLMLQPAVVRKPLLHAAHSGCSQRHNHQPGERARELLAQPTPTATLTIAGELDCSNCADVTARVERLCQQRDRRVRIDLGAVTFIDAATVRTFLRAHHRPRAVGCEVVLRNVHGFPLLVLQLLGVDDVLVEREATE